MNRWWLLLRFWLARDLKTRYAGSALGLAWAVVQPLATMAMFYVLFARIFRVRVPELAADAGYLYYLLAGLLPWLTSAEALGRGTGVLVAHEDFLRKQAFPVEILPVVAVLSAWVPQLVGTLVLAGLLALAGPGPHSGWLLLPLLWLAQTVILLGAVMLAALTNYVVRDLASALPFLLQVLFYAAPIVYPLATVPESWRPFFLLNPFACLVMAQQHAWLGTAVPPGLGLALLAWCVILGGGGIALFRALKPALGEAL